MTLSTLDIKTLIEQVTDKYINHSNYAALNSSCISLTSIADITKEIQEELNHLLEIDKQNAIS